MEGLSTASIILIAIGGLFALAVAFTALGYLMEWIGEVIELLGHALAMGIIKVLGFPFWLIHKLYIRWFGKKTIVIPAPKPEPTVVRRRSVTFTEEEISKRQ